MVLTRAIGGLDQGLVSSEDQDLVRLVGLDEQSAVRMGLWSDPRPLCYRMTGL